MASTTQTPSAPLANLARRAASGDQEALERLLSEAQALVWRFSQTVCGHTEDAEDASQEALAQTFRHIPRLRDPDAFRPWLYRTVRNACLMSRRRRAGEPSHHVSIEEMQPGTDAVRRTDVPATDLDPEQLAVNAALRRQLAGALAKLPPALRVIVFLRDLEGLSTRDAARALRVSEDVVKTRLHRARVLLRRELTDAPAEPKLPA